MMAEEILIMHNVNFKKHKPHAIVIGSPGVGKCFKLSDLKNELKKR